MFMLFVITDTIFGLVVGIAFFLLTLFCVVNLIIHSLKWRIVVKEDLITVYAPFRAVREIRVEDITTVRVYEFGFIAFAGAKYKKVLSIGQDISGYELLYNQLLDAGKMEFTQIVVEESFVVRRQRKNMIIVLALFLLFAVLLIAELFWGSPSDSDTGGRVAVAIGFVVFAPFYIAHCIRWRMTVAGNMLSVRHTIGTEKSYDIKEITKVDLKSSTAILYVGAKKIAKVPVEAVNFKTLAVRLTDEGIPAYHRGKLVE